MPITNRRPLTRLTWLLALPLLLTVGPAAGAGETTSTTLKKQTINGSACIVGPTSDRTDPTIEYAEAGVAKLSPIPGNFVTVFCPIIRTNTANTNGLNDIDVRFRGSLTTTTGTAQCTATSLKQNGDPLFSVTKSVAISGNVNVAKIDFNTSLNKSEAPNGSYALRCQVPPNVFLLQVLVVEY